MPAATTPARTRQRVQVTPVLIHVLGPTDRPLSPFDAGEGHKEETAHFTQAYV